jgi:hypothetical protein
MSTTIDVTKLTAEQFAELQALVTARAEELSRIEAERTEQEHVQNWIDDLAKCLTEMKDVNRESVLTFVFESVKGLVNDDNKEAFTESIVEYLKDLNPKKVRRSVGSGKSYFEPVDPKPGSKMAVIRDLLQAKPVTKDELTTAVETKFPDMAKKNISWAVKRALGGALAGVAEKDGKYHIPAEGPKPTDPKPEK